MESFRGPVRGRDGCCLRYAGDRTNVRGERETADVHVLCPLAEMAKSDDADRKLMEKAFASGTIVGYGNDSNLIHTPDGSTHDGWWSAMSMAAVLNVLDQAYKSGSATSPVLGSATKHWDSLYLSRYYNWHAGSWKDGYTHASSYTLKPDAPTDAVDKLSKNMIVPLMEKMLVRFTNTKSIPKRSHPGVRHVLDFLYHGRRRGSG
jgi:hypothetical protein